MSVLAEFLKRHAAVSAAVLLGASLVGGAGYAVTPEDVPVRSAVVTAGAGGHGLLEAAQARDARQFSDLERIVRVVRDVVPLDVVGAEKARMLAKAERQIADAQPDGGAARYDGLLFSVADALPEGSDMEALLDTVNGEKRDLNRAAYDLVNIKFALISGNAEALDAAAADLDGVLARHHEARPTPPHDIASAGMKSVSLDDARQAVMVEVARIDVLIDPKRIVTIPR